MNKWFERSFDVLNPNLSFAGIIERLKGTPWRLNGMLSAIPAEYYTSRVDDTWSIQENAGHLLELEALWLERARNFLDGKPELESADLTNTATDKSNYNDWSMQDIMNSFEKRRMLLVSAMEHLQREMPDSKAFHPRLKTPMRPVDLAFFVAEHDDHHLATISEICTKLEIW